MARARFPWVSREQMAKVDRLAVESGLAIMQMMEHAGLQLARLTQRVARIKGPVVILAGRGNNGADGLAAARFLTNWGKTVQIVLVEPEARLSRLGRHHLQMAKRMRISIQPDLPRVRPAAIVDALLGYNGRGNPRGPYAQAITWANRQSCPRLACDLPSGLHATTGRPSKPTVQATHTLTLALPKIGLRQSESQAYVGQLWLADLGIPRFVYRRLGIRMPTDVFSAGGLRLANLGTGDNSRAHHRYL